MLPDLPDTGNDGLGAAALRVMLQIALHQQEPLRTEMLDILRADGWVE
jgi:hypothetical protein